MDSVRGTRSVRLQRRKSGLGFSIKGGSEHGIPIVVSDVETNTSAAGQLHLGDELISINGVSLRGRSHINVVQLLRSSGQTVSLTLKSNQLLEDIFLSSSNEKAVEKSHPIISQHTQQGEETDALIHETEAGPLPPGWERIVDHKTGRSYYENHYTMTSTWSDPCSLVPCPLKEFDWHALPAGWECFADDYGDVYYVNHDTQTTHWDSPRGTREQHQLQQLQQFLQEQRSDLKDLEKELYSKRQLLLEMNQQLETRNQQQEELQNEEERMTNGAVNSNSDLIEDMMLLNEEVEDIERRLQTANKLLQQLGDIAQEVQCVDIGDKDRGKLASKLAEDLSLQFTQFRAQKEEIHKYLSTIETQRLSEKKRGLPLNYMLQLAPQASNSNAEEWIHTLPDKLTGKTSCEMRLELCLMKECINQIEALHEKVRKLVSSSSSSHVNWSRLTNELSLLDFTILQDDWLQLEFKEKMEKFVTSHH